VRDWLDHRRRALQLGLGVVWLLDAALQYQPYMFSQGFPHQILAPVGPGNPSWVARPVHWAAHLTASHLVAVNALFATVQLLIALGLFTRATVRLALAGSVVWALGVWWMGEGLGGLLVGPQSPIMGSPGAALLYAMVSVLLWPREQANTPPTRGAASVATTSPLGDVASRLAWLALWAGFALESLQAANRSPSALYRAIVGMADGEPRWLRAIDRHAGRAVDHHGTEVSILLAVLFGLVAVAVCCGPRLTRAGLVTATVLAAVVWVVGQNLGEIATGQATDPNTGPLLVLLAATYWPVSAPWRGGAPAPPARSAQPVPASVPGHRGMPAATTSPRPTSAAGTPAAPPRRAS
jgi:hypothetical protein